MTKKIHIITRGCQMNLRDSEFVTGILLERGFKMAKSAEVADGGLFKSCSVRKHAEDRLISNIAELKGLKKKRPDLVIGLMGCTAQSYKEDMLEKVPTLDLVCGPGNEADLPGIISDVLKNRCAIVATDKVDKKRQELFPKYRKDAFKAYVSISEGCDNFCSYCIVPYVRGRERSRKEKDIIKEVRDLAERGFKEITLLGQNVNSYQSGRKNGLIHLLERLNTIRGIERIRFMTSHPKDASIDLFKAMRDLDRVCEHLHLPAQSGSDRILKLMNRGYAQKKYLQLVEAYRKFVPKGSITTDIIAGFPSETEEDFNATMGLMKKIGFDSAYIFKYSPRPPAKSANLKDDVPKEAKQDRLKRLLDLQSEISRMQNEPMKGRTVDVLVDDRCGDAVSTVTGRTRTNKMVFFEGEGDMIGKLVDDIEIESVTPHALKGRMVR